MSTHQKSGWEHWGFSVASSTDSGLGLAKDGDNTVTNNQLPGLTLNPTKLFLETPGRAL